MKRLLLLICLLLVFASYTHAQTPVEPVTVGWIAGDELWLAGENIEPFQYTVGAHCCALFSPAGTKLAYQHTAENGLVTLIIVNTTSPQETIMIATPNDFTPNSLLPYTVWRDEEQLVLTTFDQPLARLRYDLWQINAAEGEVIQMRPFEQGGRPYPAPGGEHLVVEKPGIYDQQPASIEILDTNFSTLARYEYPALSAATDFVSPWLPEPVWIGDRLRFVVPPPDLIYDLIASTPSKVIELELDGAVHELGEVRMNLVLPAPRWSPDGQQLAFIRYDETSPTLFDLLIWDVETQTETLIRDNIAGYIALMGWNEDYLVFVEGTALTDVVLWSSNYPMMQFSQVMDVAVKANGDVIIARRQSTGYEVLLIRADQTITIAEIPGEPDHIVLAQY